MRNARVERARARCEDADGTRGRYTTTTKVLAGTFDVERGSFIAVVASSSGDVHRDDDDDAGGGAMMMRTSFRSYDAMTGTETSSETLWTNDVDADEVLVDEPREIVGLACALELSSATCATSSGEYATCEVDRVGKLSGCECVGEVPGGVVAFAWCPDGEVCATLTRKGTVIVMTKDLYPVKEEEASPAEDGELSGGTISWRGDGRYFACSSTNAKSGETTMRVWQREDVSVESVGEKGSATSGATATLVGAGREDVPLAWQPRGALIAAAARADNGEDVNDRIVFYERNGLRRGDFTLPGNDEAHVTSLAWSADSACLGVAVRYAKTGERAVQIWTRSNMHWYLKHETRYDASEGKVRMEWDLESGSTLRAFTERGLLERFNLFWETTVSDCGTCAVVDGDALLITPMFRTPVPPPLCAAKIVFDAPVVAAAFRPHRRSGAAETIAALLSTGEIATATSAAGTDWERTADAFADSEAAATWSRWNDNEVPCDDARVALASQHGSDALAEHLTWVDDSHLVHVVRRAEDDVSEIVLTSIDGRGETSRRIVPEAIGALTSSNGVAFALARDSSNAYAVDASDTVAGGGEAFSDARIVRSSGVPSAASAAKIVSARGLDVGARYVAELGVAADEPAGALVTLDAKGDLRIGNIDVASRVTSFAIHVAAGDGCAVTTPDASADVAAIARDPSRWGADAPSARVAYVTREHQLLVAEVGDIIANGAKTRAIAHVAEDDAHIGHWLAERSAADGARMGDITFSDLHQRMRRAMRPEAAKTAADATTRQVEDGARIVACAPGTTSVVLQMPRGNLETVAPKALVLPAVACALRAGRYKDAYKLAAKQRVDLNLIVDYGWPNFIDAAEAFVKDVDSAEAIMELLESLEDKDITAPGNIYEELVRLYPPAVVVKTDDTGGAAVAKVKVTKIDSTCAAIRSAIEAHGAGGKWELAVLTSYASGDNPDLGSALRRVATLRERELAESAANALNVSASARKLSDVDAAAALKHLLYLVGSKTLYSGALGTYDLSLAYLVAQHAQMDPGEYVAELQELQDMREHQRRAEIAKRLGKYEAAITEHLLDEDVQSAGAVALDRKLFPHALAEAARLEHADARNALLLKNAEALSGNLRYEDAAVARLAAGDAAGALEEYKAGLSWQQALALAGRLGLSPNAIRDIAEELCGALSLTDPLSAARVAERYLRDVDRSVELLSSAKAWREASEVAYRNERGDLMETTIAPACAGAAEEHVETFKENKARAEKYSARLRDLQKHRERAAQALTLGGADWNELGGRPKAGFGVQGGDEDDAMSDVLSLASGMSAYTDRTGLTSVVSGTSAASTVGGRKAKKRKDKGKNKRSSLRAGSPTEERDLSLHVLALAPLPKTLEEIGELLELLVLLGHESDARTLQRVVGECVETYAAAHVDAEKSLKELKAIAKAQGEPLEPFEPKDANAAATEWKWSLLRAS